VTPRETLAMVMETGKAKIKRNAQVSISKFLNSDRKQTSCYGILIIKKIMDPFTYILVMASPLIVLYLIIWGAEKIKTYTWRFLFNTLNLGLDKAKKVYEYLFLVWLIPVLLVCLGLITGVFF